MENRPKMPINCTSVVIVTIGREYITVAVNKHSSRQPLLFSGEEGEVLNAPSQGG